MNAIDGLSGASDWGEFPHTILHFPGPDALSLDLRENVSRREVRALTRLGLEHTFGIVTAQDPMGVAQAAAHNQKLAADLERDIAAMGVPFAPVDACSPDRSHCERSLAVAIPCAELVELARGCQQLAIFWFDGGGFWIVPAMSANDRVRLPLG